MRRVKSPGYSIRSPKKFSGKGKFRALYFPDNYGMNSFIFLHKDFSLVKLVN